MGDANARLTVKPGQHCRILAAIWIWRAGRGQEGRKTSHCSSPYERWWVKTIQFWVKVSCTAVGNKSACCFRGDCPPGSPSFCPSSLPGLRRPVLSNNRSLILKVGTASCLIHCFILGAWAQQVLNKHLLNAWTSQMDYLKNLLLVSFPQNPSCHYCVHTAQGYKRRFISFKNTSLIPRKQYYRKIRNWRRKKWPIIAALKAAVIMLPAFLTSLLKCLYNFSHLHLIYIHSNLFLFFFSFTTEHYTISILGCFLISIIITHDCIA